MTNLGFLNDLSIDSLKIRIPLQLVKKVNSTFDQIQHIITDDAEILETFKKDSFPIEKNGIKTKYLIQSLRVSKAGEHSFLCILFNSKLLEKRYLEGINKKNIRVVYDALMAQEIVYFDYEVFLNSPITDVDIKRDSHICDYLSMFQILESNTKEDKRAFRGHLPFKSDTNRGIQWSDRRKGTMSNPYLKVYHKGIELRNHEQSIIFYESYIKGNIEEKILDNCIRTEFTFKNKKHFAKYNIENTLNGVFKKSQLYLLGTLKLIVNKHINRLPRQTVPSGTKITPSQQKCLNAMQNFFTYTKLGVDSFITMYIKNLEERTARRAKKECKLVYNKYIITANKDRKNNEFSDEEIAKELEDIFNDMGIQ